MANRVPLSRFTMLWASASKPERVRQSRSASTVVRVFIFRFVRMRSTMAKAKKPRSIRLKKATVPQMVLSTWRPEP